MSKESAMSILQRDILLQEAKRSNDFLVLKKQLNITYESLKPINLIKNTIHDMTSSTDMKDGIGKVVIGMASGYLAKKAVFGSSHNPFKILAGLALQTIVSKVASKNSDKIKNSGFTFFNVLKAFLLPKKDKYTRINSDLTN